MLASLAAVIVAAHPLPFPSLEGLERVWLSTPVHAAGWTLQMIARETSGAPAELLVLLERDGQRFFVRATEETLVFTGETPSGEAWVVLAAPAGTRTDATTPGRYALTGYASGEVPQVRSVLSDDVHATAHGRGLEDAAPGLADEIESAFGLSRASWHPELAPTIALAAK